MEREDVLAELKRTLAMDHHFKDGRILSSICTTPHELAIEAHTMFIEANLGNPDLYPGTKQLEIEIIRILSELFHGTDVGGHMTSGGTEANITALWIARKRSGKNEVLYPKTAHFSIIKSIDLLNMTPIEIQLDEQYRMSIDDVEDKVSKNTAAIVCMAGTTELGMIDPISELSNLFLDNFHLHVDAAFGGFVVPFLKELSYQLPPIDFELPGVSSFNTDPHKMGFSTTPIGALLFRDKKYLDRITVDAPYLISMKHSTLTGTKNSGAVAATYAVLRYLGRNGFKEIVKQCMKNTNYLVSRIQEIGLEIVTKPVMNIVGIKTTQPEKIQRELANQNWFVSKGQYPRCIRLVLMPHVTRSAIDNFIPVLEQTNRMLGEL